MMKGNRNKRKTNKSQNSLDSADSVAISSFDCDAEKYEQEFGLLKMAKNKQSFFLFLQNCPLDNVKKSDAE